MKTIIILLIFVLIIIVYSIDITVMGFEENGDEVGKKGAAVLNTDYFDDKNIFLKSDIEEKTSFSTEASDQDDINYKINCRLWKAEGINFKIFCIFNETIPKGEYSLNLNAITFLYGTSEINLISNSDLKVKKKDSNIINLYSDVQKINIESGINTYNLKFKINSYNKEKLFFTKDSIYTYLEKCSVSEKELNCYIDKEKLEEIMAKNEENFMIEYLDDNHMFNKLNLILEIKIIHKYVIKKDIFVDITKLLVNCSESDTYIAYKTNVSDISKVYTSTETFTMTFDGEESKCGFRKYEQNPLLMVCFGPQKSTTLDDIKEEIILKNISVKYNFRIQPSKNKDKIITDTSKQGSFIQTIYPDVLDFRTNDSLSIYYYMEEASGLDGITFNENSNDLECENLNKKIKKCTVNKDHFVQNINKFYFTKHTNHLNGKSISYEAPPIKVIVKSSIKTFIIVLLIIFGIVGLLVLYFVIMHLRSKRPNFETKTTIDDIKHVALIETE